MCAGRTPLPCQAGMHCPPLSVMTEVSHSGFFSGLGVQCWDCAAPGSSVGGRTPACGECILVRRWFGSSALLSALGSLAVSGAFEQ